MIELINAHTHIFTIDHVPKRFARGMFPFSGLITVGFIKRIWPGIRRLQKWNKNLKYKYFYIVSFLKLLKWPVIWLLRRFGIGIKPNLLGKKSRESIARYLRFMDYSYSFRGRHIHDQNAIFERLKSYYPANKSGFVTLSMDMNYMKAGKSKTKFSDQLNKMSSIVNNNPAGTIYPFICIDPRRISDTKTSDPFSYKKYISYLEDKNFTGIKIYPALGFFPFDWRLLPMYIYAKDNKIPIMTHCSHGPVYYRGRWKKKLHGVHPFGEIDLWKKSRKGENIEHFSVNFTNPLNYLVLTNSSYLGKYLKSVDKKVFSPGEKEIWEQEIKQYVDKPPDLSSLKICLAHWGSGEEWDRYLEDHLFTTIPGALDNLHKKKIFKKVWDSYSWFYTIKELLEDVRYNFYTDISFTLHEEKYLNMLKVNLLHPRIRERVLFGTDYYVVSHKETEREFAIDVRGALEPTLWKQISYTNPTTYLRRINPSKKINMPLPEK